MNTSITIGTITIHQSENGLYLLTDLWKAGGGTKHKRPLFWLKTEGTKNYIEFLIKNEVRNLTSFESNAFLIINTGEKSLHGTYACKELVYSYAMWVSCEFHHLVVTTFDALLNATTPDELQAIKDKLSWSMGELVQMEARHPKDERTLSAILGKACSQVYPYFKHFVGIGELEQVRVPQPDKFIYRPTPRSTIVIGSKGDMLLFDAKAVKKLLPTQLDLVDFIGGVL